MLLIKMMIVSDDRECRKTFLKLFDDKYDILEADGVKEAIDMLYTERSQVKAVVLDMQAVTADSVSFISGIRNDMFLHEIPVFAITAQEDAIIDERILELGVSDFLRKPFNPRAVRNKIDYVVNLYVSYTDRMKYLQRQTLTFIMEYDYKKDSMHIDSIYKDFVRFDLDSINVNRLDWLDGVVYRPDAREIHSFLDLSDVNTTVSRTLDARFMAVSGRYEWFRLSLTCHVGVNGTKERLIITVKNVNEEMTAFKELEFLAKSDQLTRIPNKETFFIKTRALLDEKPDTQFVLIRMDVDRFRVINQLYGSVEGDNLLKYLAVKIMECVESTEGGGTYCRLESDAYAICVPNDEEYVDELERYIQEALLIYPLKFDVKVSFGRYVIENRQSSINTMLDRAFAAQKLIKGSYVKHSAYYDEKLREKEAQEHRIIMEMRDALERGQFVVFLQPKCDMASGRIVGSEALVRWIHPERGMISPGVFIPVFEKNGFVTEIDRYVLENCCKLIRRWIDEGIPVHPISVNISRTDLYNPRLFKTILETVDRYALPHEYIEFELTESSFVLDNLRLTSIVNDLRLHNFKVLMDDFGSGYSSLNCLRELPVDVLKIDIKFLPASAEDIRARAILSTVVKMAKKLDLAIVVEGVEKADQVDFLMSIGCRVSQGYFFYRPMPVKDYETELIIRNRNIGEGN